MPISLTRRGFVGTTMAAAAATGVSSAITTLPAHGLSTVGSPPAYGPAPGIAKLNANENPYGPSGPALEAMIAAAGKGAYYVGQSVPRLISMLAERHGLAPENVTLSSGSSGVLTYIAVAKAREGRILGPDLFWDTTTRAALRQGGEMKRIGKTPDLGIDLDALEKAITPDVAMVQICNPNNPTAMVVDPVRLRAFCLRASKKCTVLVDEAYNEITDKPEANSMVPLVKAGHDVVVARTFSKIYGLAGMRVGYMLASPENTEKAQRFGLGNYAMNQAGVAAAVASYDDAEFLAYSKSKIVEAREMIKDAVHENGLRAAPSQTSFVFVDLGRLNAETFRQKMADRGVLIRGIYQDYTNWSRVSAGLLPDVAKYTAMLPRVLEEMKA